MLRRHSGIPAFALAAVGAGAAVGYAGWLPPDRAVEFCALILTSILVAAAAIRTTTTSDWTIASTSFVVNFTSLMLFGRDLTMLVAGAGAVTGALASVRGSDTRTGTGTGVRPLLRQAADVATVLVATQAAGFVHDALGGTPGHFAWPAQALPIAAAVAAYCLATSASTDVIAPLIAKQPVTRAWGMRLVSACSHYAIGASIAVGLAEILDRRAWELLPVLAVPLALTYIAYRGYLRTLDEACRRKEVLDSVDQGMLAVDAHGVVTFWSDSLERLLECSRERAIGSALVDAVPALPKTMPPRAIQEVLTNRTARALPGVTVGNRILDLKIVPARGGLTILVNDVTARAQSEQALRRSEERLALAAEGANDGLWEWDRRTQEMYFSSRWMAMVGLPAMASIGRLEHWLERVHAEDLAALKQGLDALVAGQTDELLHDHRIRHEDGTYRRVQCRGVAARGAGRRVARVAGSLTDFTEGAIAQERMRTAGVLDPLTGLSNRAEFVERLGQRLEEYKQHPLAGRFAALYLDLDRFKIVNDSLGHLVGDELLKAVSRRLESCLREGDALARLGGDEFAILLNRLGEETQANAIAFRIQKSLSAPFSIGGREVFTSASIGIAFGRAQYSSAEEIMRDADRAMYHAKSRGKARHELFDADMHARTLDRIGLESDLRHAVDRNAFELHYQPIVRLDTGMCVGFESLIRWTRNGELVPPATFIPMAEELGLIEPVGTWCLEQACAAFADWKRQFPESGLEYITVNVSSRQLVQHNFLALVERVVEQSGVKPAWLRLEITETALMDSPAAAAGLLRELRDFGVKIYLDDFGTGYSSLSHLHRLPVDALKIDRSFVKSLGLPERPAIVESILALARTMNTSVVAEGIETDVQAHELERLGCTHAQGYWFSRPVPRSAAEGVLAANRPLSPNKVRALRERRSEIAIPA